MSSSEQQQHNQLHNNHQQQQQATAATAVSTVSIHSSNPATDKMTSSPTAATPQTPTKSHKTIWSPILDRLSPSGQLYFALGYLGLSFSVIFTGFNVAQSFITTIFQGSFGFTVLFLVYLPFGFAALLAPLLINSNWLGRLSAGRSERLALSASSLGYVLFVVSVASRNQQLVIVSAILCGLCSGVLWIGQGVWLTKSVKHYLATSRSTATSKTSAVATAAIVDGTKIVGTATGVFFTLFNINGLLGNVIAIVSLQSTDTQALNGLMWIMVIILTTGCLMLTVSPQIFPRPSTYTTTANLNSNNDSSGAAAVDAVDAARKKQLVAVSELTSGEQEEAKIDTSTESLTDSLLIGNNKDTDRGSNRAQMYDLWQLIKCEKCRLLTPYMILQGINISFDFGNLPKYITYACRHLTNPPLSDDSEIPIRISYVFLIYGVGSIIGAILWGRVYDRLAGRLAPLIVSHALLVTLSTTLLMCTVFVPLINTSLPVLSLIGFVYGLTDFLTNSIINNSASKLFQGNDVPRFYSWYRFCFCMGYSFNAALSSLTPRLETLSDSTITGGVWDKFGWLLNVVMGVAGMLVSALAGYWLDVAIRRRALRPQGLREDVQVIYASRSMDDSA